MFRRLFRLPVRSPAQVDAEMREEIDAHIALGIEHLMARGADRATAERQTRARFADLEGQMPSIVASARARSKVAGRRDLVRTMFRDLEFAVRQAKRSPIFSLGIVLSLGFGIGASATVYSWMQGMILNPLPTVRDADRLITVRPDPRLGFGISLDEYAEWRDQAKTVSGLAASSLGLFAIESDATHGGGTAQPIFGMFVSPNYFDVLGVAPLHGRVLMAADDAPAAEPVAVISHKAWQTRLGGRSDVIGHMVRVNGVAMRIVGVTPERFAGNLAAARFDMWVAIHTRPLLIPSEATRWLRRDYRWMDVSGRLRPGVEMPQAYAEFQAIGRRQAATFPENVGREVVVTPLDMGEALRLKPLFFALMCVTTLVVLLICSNVANLLLTRAATRHRELAVRLSLGASRRRLAGQLLTESCGLAGIGALLGAAMAVAGQKMLPMIMPSSAISIEIPSQLDFRFVAFVIGITGACVIVFGLAPALIGSRVNLVDTLKDGGRGSGASRSRTRSGLVIAQFVFALSTLVMAALFLRRDRSVHAMDLGFRGPEQVLVVQTEISMAGRQDIKAWGRAIEQAADKIEEVPGVRSVAIGSFTPLGLFGYTRRSVTTAERRSDPGAPDLVLVNGVSAGYFDLMGIPVLEGRPITDDDAPGRVATAVVNSAFAGKFFPGQSAIGRTFALGGNDHLIVGIVANGRYDYRAIDVADAPMVYYSWKQTPTSFVAWHVRVDGNPLARASAVRSAIHEIDATIPLLPPLTLQEYVGVPFTISRTALAILTILGTVALGLASMGLFSVISYGVTLRTREVGIRMALGATQLSVMGMFLRNALRLIIYGTTAGIVASLGLVALLRAKVPLLPTAQITEFTAPVLTLALFAIAAGLIPARRAAAVDPANTLREE